MLHKLTMAIVGAAALAAQTQLNGKFIFADDNTLGVIEFDGKGNVTGSQFKQSAGVVPFTGSYSVASDGSGSVTLLAQTVDEEGVSAPAALANFQFLKADAKGFSAMQVTNGDVSVAKFAPVYTAKSISGSYSFESEGKSSSGEARAELGLIQFIADGNLSGKQIVKQSGATELNSLSGSYVAETNGFFTIRLDSPGAVDEDGQASVASTSLTAVVSSDGTIVALRRGAGQPGVVTFEPVR